MNKFFIILAIPLAMNSPAAELEKVIAHRGASYDAPENTAAAIGLALEKGAKVIEFDVRQTSDGSLFLFHDGNLKRLCGRDETFEKLTSDEAKKIDVGSWFTRGSFPDETPLTLDAAIRQCVEGGAIPLIEHKSGTPEAYSKVLNELDAVDDVIVQSFDWSFIEELRKIVPDLKIGALGKKKLSAKKDILKKLKPDWVGWSSRDISKSDIHWLKENNFLIAIWTVNDPARAQYLIDCGANKIITDRPQFIGEKIKSDSN